MGIYAKLWSVTWFVRVGCQVCRMSKPLPGSAVSAPRCKQSKSAATNAMLLSVSFYVIFTTLPATVVYVLYAVFPEGERVDTTTCLPVDLAGDVTWQRYVVYQLVQKIVYELCLSHYACNFVMFCVTGLEFRRELRRMLGCPGAGRDDRRPSENGAGTEYTLTTVPPTAAPARTAHRRTSQERSDELRSFVDS